jgi:hypothetical protein
MSAANEEYPRRTGWPTFSQYCGGGIILSPSTSEDNIRLYCDAADLLRQVREQISAGREVIIHPGRIVSAQSANAGPDAPGQKGLT